MKDRNRYWDCLDQAIDASHGGRAEEALLWFEEALKADPDGAEAHNGRGEVLWDAGRVEEALYAFEQAIAVDPKFVTAHLNRAELLIEDLGEYLRATKACDQLLAGDSTLPRVDRSVELELYYLKAKAFYYQDDLPGALFLIRRALKIGGEVPLYRVFEGQVLFESGNFEEARTVLEGAARMDPDSAHAVYYLGLVLEHLGEPEAAPRAFEAADALDPDHYPRPNSFEVATFDEVLRSAIADLPRSLRSHLPELPVRVEDLPKRELLRSESFSPQTLGVFHGIAKRDGVVSGASDGENQILLYKRNFERLCRDEGELFEQLQLVLKHEVGRSLGLDEFALEGLGLL